MQQDIKTIGLIGGMGWESSKIYYERANRRVNELLGGSHSAKLIMVSVDFAEIEALTFANKWDGIANIVVKSAKQLERAGADMIVLCTNLIHIVSDAITAQVTIPFLHIAMATGKAVQEQKLKRVLLLGTKHTMEKDFYTKTLRDHYGLDIAIPDEMQRNQIHDIIYRELIRGSFTNSSKRQIVEIIHQEQAKNGVEGVILACTELPMLIKKEDLDIPMFDTGNIHINQAVDRAIKTDNDGQLTKNSSILETLLSKYIKGMSGLFSTNDNDAIDAIGKMIHKL